MVTVDQYARIRRAHLIDQMSIRELARRFNHSRRKILEILAHAEPKPYQRRPMPSILDPFKPVIEAILQTDATAPAKQQHTAAKIHRRLRDEYGYVGGYDRVRRYVYGQTPRRRETFIPLDHDPGQRLEADFGHIYVDFPEGRRQVPVLLLTWAYSNCPFALALPTERTEAILHGLVEGFHFFGCVPHEVWWDNPKTVAPHLFVGRARQLNERYLALSSHYAFEPLFCMVRRPQEKPHVEGRVRHLQRDWATPVPRVQDLAELNAHLRACCLRDRDRTQAGRTETIGRRFACETDKALSLPGFSFDPCLCQPAQVDKYQQVRFDTNRYSVPRSAAFQKVTIKAYVDRIDVVLGRQVIASHPRSYGRHKQILIPEHYLPGLERRPAALDHANVFRCWRLPAVFDELRKSLERQHGARRGAKQYIRVLELLQEHPIDTVQRVIERSRTESGFDVEAILQRVRRRVQDTSAVAAPLATEQQPAVVRAVQVPLPDLAQFNQFLSSGEKSHDRCSDLITEDQPETPPAADDERRVRGPGPRGGDGQRELPAVPPAADRIGGSGAGGQRAQGPDQASNLPGAERLRQLRLHGPAFGEQAQGPGTGQCGLDRTALQHLLHRQFRNREDAPRHCLGPGSVPPGLACPLPHRRGLGEPSRRGPEAVPARTLLAATGASGPADLRRTGLSVVQPTRRRNVVPAIRRPLRAQESAGDEQLAVWRLGASLSGRTHDSSVVGSLDAPLSHFRDEWRKLSLPRVDEGEEGGQIKEMNPPGRGNPRHSP